jgi:N-sulfoglucosamine sulfohydrolase
VSESEGRRPDRFQTGTDGIVTHAMKSLLEMGIEGHESRPEVPMLSRSLLCALAVVAPVTTSAVRAAEPAKPLNLPVVTADDMNADSAGWNGSKLGATPNLDAFATTANRFVNNHVTVPICQPGRSALMTGRVPHRNSALGFNPIRRDVPTLVEVLRDAGYYTAVIAKAVHMAPADKFPWHAVGDQALGKQPTKLAAKFREMLATPATAKKPFFIKANICDPHRPFINGPARGRRPSTRSTARRCTSRTR